MSRPVSVVSGDTVHVVRRPSSRCTRSFRFWSLFVPEHGSLPTGGSGEGRPSRLVPVSGERPLCGRRRARDPSRRRTGTVVQKGFPRCRVGRAGEEWTVTHSRLGPRVSGCVERPPSSFGVPARCPVLFVTPHPLKYLGKGNRPGDVREPPLGQGLQGSLEEVIFHSRQPHPR